MNSTKTISETVSLAAPRFLVGRARTQWKAIMVRNTPVEQAGITMITIDDVMGDIAGREIELDLAA